MCDTYIQAFKNNGDISFAGMREVAVNDLKLTIQLPKEIVYMMS